MVEVDIQVGGGIQVEEGIQVAVGGMEGNWEVDRLEVVQMVVEGNWVVVVLPLDRLGLVVAVSLQDRQELVVQQKER